MHALSLRLLIVPLVLLLYGGLALSGGRAWAIDLLTYGDTGIAPAAPAAEAVSRVVRYRVSFNSDAAFKMQPGEPARVLLGNDEFDVVLDRIERHRSGNETWIGHVVVSGAGKDYRVLLTRSEQGVSGRFETPQGLFKLESSRQGTWLIDVKRSGLVERGSAGDDARVPPPPPPAPESRGRPETSKAEASVGGEVPIDLLVVYTPGMLDLHGSEAAVRAEVDRLIAYANQTYQDSAVNIRLRLTDVRQVPYPDKGANSYALTALTDGWAGVEAVGQWRDELAADLVTLIRPYDDMSHGGCGIAWLAEDPRNPADWNARYGYSVVSNMPLSLIGSGVYCMDRTLVHELGHNMGANHDRATLGVPSGAGGEAYPYAFGHGVDAAFYTIMAYGSFFSGAEPVGKFSNPNILCMGQPCGVAVSEPAAAYNALVLANASAAVSSYRSSPEVVLSGNILAGGTALDGVAFTTGTDIGMTCSNSDNFGFFRCDAQRGISASITPVRAGYYFSPRTIELTDQLVDRSDLDFSAIQYSDLDSGQIVTHYYNAILNRNEDTVGRMYWLSEVARLASADGDTGEAYMAMARYFLTSPEFDSRALGDGQFVDTLYQTFFARPSDMDGRNYWTQRISVGLPRDMVMYAFMFSPEFADYMASNVGSSVSRPEFYAVIDFYRGAFGRLPDDEGLRYWVNRIRAAQCLPDGARAEGVYQAIIEIAAGFFDSPDYWASGAVTNRRYVSDLYNAFMRRSADIAGFDFWVDQLIRGTMTHGQIRKAFIDSPEFANRVGAIATAGCATPM